MDAAVPHLVHVFSTFAAAGPQLRTVQLIDALGQRYRHTIVPCDGRREALGSLHGCARVDCVDPPARARGIRAHKRMHALLDRLEPDLLLTYNWGSFDAVLAAHRLAGLPLLHHEDGFNADEAARQKLRRVLARRLALPRAQKVVVPSQRLARIARESWHIEPARLEFIPNGIDAQRFVPGGEPSRLRQALGVAPDALVIGAVGHLRPVKNFARLIAACARVDASALAGREVHLWIVGDGPERRALTERGQATPPPGGRVHFAGHQSDLVPWYQAMDVCALSSDSEQHPVALIEAMACGLPVVATDVGDVCIVLPDEQAPYLATLGAHELAALAVALTGLLGDPKRRAHLGRLNRARVIERYSFGEMLARYASVYAELWAKR